MIDLHTHILPGIDDGAKSLAESVEMCRAAAAEGCTALVATPHQRRGVWWNTDAEELAALRGELERALGAHGPRILAGGEIHVDSQLLAEVEQIGQIPGSGLQPLAGSRYLLIEFPGFDGRAGEAISLVHELTVAGWRPIVAHPEFIPWLAADFRLVERLIEVGAATQVTAMSVTGDFGRRPQQDTHGLIDAGLVHFIASDCHGVQKRPPGLQRAYQAVSARWGEAAARLLLTENPRAVIEDRPIPGMATAGAAGRPSNAAGR